MPEFVEPVWLWLLLALPAIAVLRYRSRIAETPLKRALGTGLRCLGLAALVVALAGPLEGSYTGRTDVIFVLDVSASVGEETVAEALRFVDRVLDAKDATTRAGLIAFGADAAVERMPARTLESVEEISVQVARDGTDIAGAIELALGTFQPGVQRRIVLLSDGRETSGRARAAAAVARSVGVEVHTVALEKDDGGDEILVHAVNAPSRVPAHEPFEVEMILASERRARAHLIITRNGSPVDETVLTLESGLNSYAFIDRVGEPGLYEYEAVVNSEHDDVQENNRYQTFVQVRGPPKVLHAVGDPDWGRYVTSALRAQGLSVDELPGTGLPSNMHELSEYDLVVLNNVPGFDMSLAKMDLLEAFVRDAGGGLIKLGGDKSYGAGGYQATSIERALPVTMDIKSEVRIPSVAVTIVIDKSGSMSSAGKLAIAKDAAFSAIEVLNPLDQVGVLAFSDRPEWAVEPREVGSRRAIVERLRLVESGGGTDLYAALEEAHRAMTGQSARVKHLIVLSDGLTDDEQDFRALVDGITGDGVTVSTVAFGADSDRSLMESIAAWGQGRHYYTHDPGNIPRIFTSETLVISRNLFVEGDFRPTPAYPGEMLDGFDVAALPVLSGYQRVYAKPAAQVLLAASEGDPLLVSWRYGLGKSVAFTSDLAGRWGRRWVEWPELGRFVAQMARWTMRRRGTERLLPAFRWSGQRAEVLVDALDRDDGFVNGLELRGTVIDQRRSARPFSFEQVAPGRYRGEFAVPSSGRYYINLSGRAGDLSVGPTLFGLAVPYSQEYLDLGVDRPLLQALSDASGGQLLPLAAASIPVILSASPAAATRKARVWWPVLMLALIAVLLEVAVRKIVIPDAWRRRWQSARRQHRQTVEAQPAYDELVAEITRVRESHLAALRERVRYHPDDPAARARLYLSSGDKPSRR